MFDAENRKLRRVTRKMKATRDTFVLLALVEFFQQYSDQLSLQAATTVAGKAVVEEIALASPLSLTHTTTQLKQFDIEAHSMEIQQGLLLK